MSISQKLQHFLHITGCGAMTLYILYHAASVIEIWTVRAVDGGTPMMWFMFRVIVTAGILILVVMVTSSFISAIRSARSKKALEAKYPLLELYVFPILMVIGVIVVTFFLPPLSGQ